MRTIRCWQLRSVLTSYVDDEVSAGERLRIEHHLQRCSACRHRVSREQAVRQRLRRWSAEMRGEGTPLSWPAGAETPPPRHLTRLFRIGAVSAAAIAIVFTIWNRWPGGDGVAFTAPGLITDSRCASGHTHSGPALQAMGAGDCVRRCVEMGALYVFVSRGVVYAIRNQDFSDLTHLAGQDVQLEGNVRQSVLTVSQVRPLTARGSNKGLYETEGVMTKVRLLATVAAVGVLAPVLYAQRETAPAGVPNYTRVDATVACAGATPAQALPELKKSGFASVINFRMPEEKGANIDESKAAAAQVGLKYIHLPFQTPTPEIAAAFLKAVSDPSNQPVYIHCASANRVGAMWFIKRVKIDGWDVDRAMKEAEAIGLRAPGLKEFALSYVGSTR